MTESLTDDKMYSEMRYRNTKIYKTTIKKLRMIYALTGIPMIRILDRLVTAELERVQREQERDDAP